MALDDYRKLLLDCKNRLANSLASGRDSPTEIAVLRASIAWMDYEITHNPQSVVANDLLSSGGDPGPVIWYRRLLQIVAKRFEPKMIDLAEWQRKFNEYLQLATDLKRSVNWRSSFDDRQNGVSYLVQENQQVKNAVGVIADGLMEWRSKHESDDDYYQKSAKDGLLRLLQEKPAYAAALRVAQSLPLDTEQIVIPIDRPAEVTAVEVLIGLVPFVGNAVAAYEAYEGKDLFGYRLSPVERTILAASVLLPLAGRLVKGGRALYTASRLEAMYGREAGQWRKVMGAGAATSSDAAAYKSLTTSELELRQAKGIIAGGKVTAAEMSDIARLLQTAKNASAAAPVIAADITRAFGEIQQVSKVFADIDELALQRVLDRGPNIDHLKGYLLEELLHTRIAKMLRDPAGLEALGIAGASKQVEFIPGHLIRSTDGRQLTDGILAQWSEGRLQILAIFEAKAGPHAARELSIARTSMSRISVDELRELRAYSKDVLKELQEEARLRGTTVTTTLDQIQAAIILNEQGGQIRRDFERLVGSDVLIGSQRVPVSVSPTTTKAFGVLPRGFNASSIKDELKSLNYNFEILGMDVSEPELRQAARKLLPLVPP